jgi:hypothetical protein
MAEKNYGKFAIETIITVAVTLLGFALLQQYLGSGQYKVLSLELEHVKADVQELDDDFKKLKEAHEDLARQDFINKKNEEFRGKLGRKY